MQQEKDHIFRLINQGDFKINNLKPSEWAEQHRVMGTESTNFPGAFKYDRTPYLREIADCLAPDHPAREVAIIKGAQLGFSTGVLENGIGWIISQAPCNILLAARDESLVKDMVEKKIDPMLDSTGLRGMLKPLAVKARNSRTGDTSDGKEFPGGSLRTFSIQKPARARQVSAKVGFLDDFEAAPVDKDAGSADPLFRTRFKSFGDSKKIFWISTPEVKHTSNIEPLYLRGDQRKYHVPCPCCGDLITLEWKTTGKDGKRAGILFDYDEDGDLVPGSVRYKCQSCGDEFTEGHKYEMNLAGVWIPTAKQKDPTFFSYHLNALYAPPGMDGWDDYVKEYLDAAPPGGKINKPKLKVFINTALGETWEEKGKTLNVTRLAKNTRTYDVGTIPNVLSQEEGNGQIVLVTCACDLNGTEEDARIDYEIVAWAESGVTYSVDHGSVGTFIPRENTLKKKVDRERWTYEETGERNVWDKMAEIIKKVYLSEDGGEYTISIFGVDTGEFTKKAYTFVEKCNLTHGVFTVGLKGIGIDQVRKFEADSAVFRRSKERADLYLVNGNQVKDELSQIANLKWNPDDDVTQPNGFMNFPQAEGGKYEMKSFFSHFESEKRVLKADTQGKEIGYMWEKKNSNVQNHFWDCRVYNSAIKELAVFLTCEDLGIKPPNWHSFCKYITG